MVNGAKPSAVNSSSVKGCSVLRGCKLNAQRASSSYDIDANCSTSVLLGDSVLIE